MVGLKVRKHVFKKSEEKFMTRIHHFAFILKTTLGINEIRFGFGKWLYEQKVRNRPNVRMSLLKRFEGKDRLKCKTINGVYFWRGLSVV